MELIIKPNIDNSITRIFKWLDHDILDTVNVRFAGGSARKALFGELLGDSDIDVWFSSRADLNRALEDVSRKLHLPASNFKNCASVSIPASMLPEKIQKDVTSPYVKVQFITKEMYPNFESLLGAFDFTVAQFGYENGQFVTTRQAIDDASNQVIRINAKVGPSFRKRFLKFSRMGFVPTKETLKTILDGIDELDMTFIHMNLDDELWEYDAF